MALAAIAALVLVGGPLAVAALMVRRWRVSWTLFAAGAVAWVGSQVVHVPLLAALAPVMPRTIVGASIVLGLLAALCEEPARFVVYRFWVKSARSAEEGLLVGVGHGGVEAAWIGVTIAIAAAAGVANGAATTVFAVVERALTMIAHCGLSLVVLASVRRSPTRARFVVVAIVAHAAMDAGVVYLGRRHGVVAAEGAVVAAALAAAFVILFVRRAERLEREARRDVVDSSGPAPAVDQAISARKLTRVFDSRDAVSGVDFDVAPGRVLALLGPNGAGKTTTVRMLTALIAPTSGTARVAGCMLVEDADALRAKVGILTETPGLYERLSARANLDLFGRLYGLDDRTRAERIESLLRAFDLWDRCDDPVGAFSKGMKQKIAIVRALLHRPEVLFLDEPTSGLDPEASREVADMIRTLKSEGRTILLTTHRLAEAEDLADVVAVMRSKLIAFDTVDALKHKVFGRQVIVRFGSSCEEALLAAARAAPGVTRAEWNGDGGLVVSLDDPPAQTPALVRALVAADAAIVSVGEVEHSLEAVYLDLIKERQS